MKPYFALLALAFFSFAANDPIDHIGVKGPLTFDKTDFSLSWSAVPRENYYVQEYLPQGESEDHFNQMLTVNLFVMDVPVDVAVKQRMAEFEERKKTDKVCNYSITKRPGGTEFLLDVILSAGSGAKPDVAEFIIYRFVQVELADTRKALLVYSYSKRSYGDKIDGFLVGLPKERVTLLNKMTAAEMPKVALTGN
jgi:hypothetical protein